jgi:sporulation protein YabP
MSEHLHRFQVDRLWGGYGMDEREFKGVSDHEVRIVNRETMTIKGVLHVDSSDDQEIVLDTDLGLLTVRGEDLQIKQLNLDDGSFSLDGAISALQYSQGGGSRSKAKGKGFLDRLLR